MVASNSIISSPFAYFRALKPDQNKQQENGRGREDNTHKY